MEPDTNGHLSVNEHMSEPILALPMDEGTYILDCDASNYDLRAVFFPGAIRSRESYRLLVPFNEQT